MKKGVLILLFSLFLISFVLAQDEAVSDKAYACLGERFSQTSCNALSPEGKIFALLTLGECSDEVMEDSNFESNLKYTAQAILALDAVGIDVSDSIDWLWAQNQTPTDVIWYLQIDSVGATSCEIVYGSTSSTINIGEDKKLDSNAGTCLSRATGNYWLQINPTCYDEEFEISCQDAFKTNLLFKQPNENTIHVAYDTHSEGAEGTTTEKIDFTCFQQGTGCNYEGTLWSAMILNSIDTSSDLTPLIFYLTTLSDSYTTIMPEAFLYYLTGEDKFADKLIEYQNNDGSWKRGTDKYYDTALALLAVPSGSVSWNNGVKWLEEKQENSGCWNGDNFLDTAFIIYSVWYEGVNLKGEDGTTAIDLGEDCLDAGYFCMSSVNCNGEILDAYECEGFDKCCSQEEVIETCEELNGEICNSNQQCEGGTSENTFDLSYGQTCCIAGACETKTAQEYTCTSGGGVCRIDGCESDEEISSETCEFGDICCVKEITETKSSLWIWVLVFLILIILVIVGIIKKDKLREIWLRIKSKFNKSPGAGRMPGRPSIPPSAQRRFVQGRAPSRPMMSRPSRVARPSSKAPSEINDVLKRLKEMGK